MISLAEWLEREGAHHDVVGWARPYGDDWERAWAECPRGDWLLGIAARAGVNRAALVRAACACAREALIYLPEDEPRPARAIEAAERWAAGAQDVHEDARDDTQEQACESAAATAERCAEDAPHPAVQAAAIAAVAAVRTVRSPEDAPAAASAAAEAAVHDAGECAMMQALRYVQATCADHVRRELGAAPRPA